MNYYELVFTLTDGEDYQQDLLIDALGGLGFDTFEETETGFKAYTPAESFDKYQVDEALSEYEDMFTFTYEVFWKYNTSIGPEGTPGRTQVPLVFCGVQ